MLLFVAVLPGNHSEAEDAFEYSRLIEEGTGSELFHPHHLLYLPMQKAAFNTAKAFGYDGRSYYTALAVSMASGAVSLCLFYLIALRLFSNSEICCLATLGLLSSYGFVRYACEVEIYLPAMALMLVAIYSALRAEESRWWFPVSLVFAASALLMHTINAAASLVIIPLIYFLIGRRWKSGVLHIVGVLLLTGAVYAITAFNCGLFQPPVDAATEGWLQPGTLGKAFVGGGQCLLSANFIFAYDAIAESLQQLFPYRVFTEELYAASACPAWIKWISPLTFISALILLAGIAVFFLVAAFRKRVFDRNLVWILLWLGGTVSPTLLLEPSNPELWILALAPLWILFCWFAVQVKYSARMRWVLALAVGVFAFHNLIAGMGLIRNESSDYNYAKAEWILGAAKEGDTIHSADSFVFTFYLDYWSAAEIRNVNSQSVLFGDRTYVFDDVFNPPVAVGVRYPVFADNVVQVAEEIRNDCVKVREDDFGGMWVVENAVTQ